MVKTAPIRSKKKRKQPNLNALKKKAWTLVSQCIRQESADDNGQVICYTCDKPLHWEEAQAGHGIGGRHNAVLFDEEIIKTQCSGCNIFKAGNYTIFTTKLIQEHGMDWWQKKLEQSRRTVKRTRPEYESMIEGYKQRLKELEA